MKRANAASLWAPGRGFPGRGLKLAATAVLLAGTGAAVYGSASASSQQVISSSFSYACRLPSGQQTISVLVKATFPQAAVAGQAIQPTGTGITVTLPHALVSKLASPAAPVAMTAQLDTTIAVNGKSATAPWANLGSGLSQVPATGSLTLTASGTAPGVTIAAPGDATVSAAGLSFLLASVGADGSATGHAATPTQCTLTAGQNATLASIPVRPATGHSGGGQGITVGPSAGGPPVKNKFYPCHGAVAPTKGLPLNHRFPVPTPPPGSTTLHPKPPTFGCAYIVAFSNVKKLNGAALIGPGETAIQFAKAEILDAPLPYNYLEEVNTGQLDYAGLHELPPAKATFLAFGFMPVSATMQLKEIGTLNAIAVGDLNITECKQTHNCVTVTKINTEVTLRIYNVNVNGVPLNVGPSCETPPFTIELTGKGPKYNIATGGPLYGTVNIPQFTGCGVGETLDTIFDGSISGPGNFISAQQGTLCTPNSGSGCGNRDTGPSIPKPVH
jgi:hypothetical protein